MLNVNLTNFFLINKLVTFSKNVHSASHRKHYQTKFFLMISGGVERDQWHEMD